MSQIGTKVTAASMGTLLTLTGDVGGAISPTGLGDITLAGGNNITTTGAANTITFDVTGTTNNAVQVGNAGGSLTSLGVGTNGQVLLGATGADPAFADLTSTSGTIVFTPGANTLNLEATGTGPSIMTITSLDDTDSAYVVLASDRYMSCNTSAGILQINLPNAPTTGRNVTIKDSSGTADTNNITITTVGGVVLIDGATTFVMNTEYESVNLIFNGTSYEVW